MYQKLSSYISELASVSEFTIKGKVNHIRGNIISVRNLSRFLTIGSICTIEAKRGQCIDAEVISITHNEALMMPFEDIIDIRIGSEVIVHSAINSISPSLSWKGRVITPLCTPLDGKGELELGYTPYHLRSAAPAAYYRKCIGGKVDTAFKSINTLTPCCVGQRLGVFAGPGVGKSMMLAKLTKHADADIKIIGLIGERGREVQEFITDYLGEEGMKNAIIVVSTADDMAIMRRRAAYTTVAIAEFFRDLGLHVLCMVDSITRFAIAMREISLLMGEPLATRGYPPSVFSGLSRLLERTGPGIKGKGDITGFFTVLVEGEFEEDPVAEALQAVLDGHIILERALADKGIYPALNVSKSISRAVPNCNTDRENEIIRKTKDVISTYEEIQDMLRIGVYTKGSDSKLDEAIELHPKIYEFISQADTEVYSIQDSNDLLASILGLE